MRTLQLQLQEENSRLKVFLILHNMLWQKRYRGYQAMGYRVRPRHEELKPL